MPVGTASRVRALMVRASAACASKPAALGLPRFGICACALNLFTLSMCCAPCAALSCECGAVQAVLGAHLGHSVVSPHPGGHGASIHGLCGCCDVLLLTGALHVPSGAETLFESSTAVILLSAVSSSSAVSLLVWTVVHSLCESCAPTTVLCVCHVVGIACE